MKFSPILSIVLFSVFAISSCKENNQNTNTADNDTYKEVEFSTFIDSYLKPNLELTNKDWTSIRPNKAKVHFEESQIIYSITDNRVLTIDVDYSLSTTRTGYEPTNVVAKMDGIPVEIDETITYRLAPYFFPVLNMSNISDENNYDHFIYKAAHLADPYFPSNSDVSLEDNKTFITLKSGNKVEVNKLYIQKGCSVDPYYQMKYYMDQDGNFMAEGTSRDDYDDYYLVKTNKYGLVNVYVTESQNRNNSSIIAFRRYTYTYSN